MQVSRKQLKGIIKECLVEILAEGLGGSLVESVSTSQSRERMKAPIVKPRSNPALDRKVNVAQLMKEASTGNQALDNILAETARTSLDSILREDPSIYGEGSHVQVGPVDHTNGIPPEQLFGDDVASNWLAVLDRLEK